MFAEQIGNEVLLGSPEADAYFEDKIRARYPLYFGNERSFIVSLRAFLVRRADKDHQVFLGYRFLSDLDSLREATVGTECFDITDIRVLVLSDTLKKKSDIRIREELLGDKSTKFVELLDVSEYIRQNTNKKVWIYTSVEEKTVYIIMDDEGTRDFRLYHLIQAFIPRYIPWFFAEHPMTDIERDLSKSLLEKTSKAYYDIVDKIASESDLKRFFIEEIAHELITKSKQKKIADLRRIKEEHICELAKINQLYIDKLRDINSITLQIDGLECRIDEANESEFLEYVLHNKQINIHKRDDSVLIEVFTTIRNYNPDLFEKMEKREGSSLYAGYNSSEFFKDIDKRKVMIDALFGEDAEYGVKVTAGYRIYSEDVEVEAVSRNGYLKNPHIGGRHLCLGTYRPEIQKCLSNDDLISVVELCIASAQALNLAEGTQTVAPFMGEIFTSTDSIILAPDGSSLTPEEAYLRITGGKENGETDCTNERID